VRTALITTRGFKDVLQIGRQNRPKLYDWSAEPAPTLVPSDLRFEVDERVDALGKVLTKLDSHQLDTVVDLLGQNDVKSVAVCLIFSFLYPMHEQLIVTHLRNSGYFVSASSEILPEFREYERTSTTVVNAYVSPILDRYLSRLQDSLPSSSVQIMQSNGGMIGISEAKSNGARCILSGPAGGIVGAHHVSRTIMEDNYKEKPDQEVKIITFDMGGTSTDVSLIDGQPTISTEAIVGGCPIYLPLLDIHTIGAGGGSIAYIDAGGALRVGPQSAGADPGPACYGTGEEPTVTDANLILGRLIPEYFLGGKMKLYSDRAHAALTRLGEALNLSPVQTAFGILQVVNIQMERALRVISVERGHDPREFSLFSFGGAGGLHAADLARAMGIPRVIISRYASTLSALGMLASNVVKDYVQTVMLPGSTSLVQLEALFTPIVERATGEVISQGIPEDKIEILKSVDVRYQGQSYDLNIPYSEGYISNFQEAHATAYGYAYVHKVIEIVNVRVRAIGKVFPIHLPRIERRLSVQAGPLHKRVRLEMQGGSRMVPLIDYDRLSPGDEIEGPALIISPDTTIIINAKDTVCVDQYLNLLIDIGQ